MRLAFSLLQTATQPNRVELLFYVDSNDPEQKNYEQAFQQHKSQLDRFRRCSLMIGEPIGVSKAWNELAARSQGDLLVMAADDQTYNTAGWDDRLLLEVQRFPDQIFCAWFNDGHWGEKLCTFPIVSRKWCLTLGYFTTGLFECLYDDLWIMDLARRLNRLHYIPDILTEHLHWSYGKSEIDETYAWKQVNPAGQLKPAVRRDMDLFSRTAPYRIADAQRLQQMCHLTQALQPGLALMGRSSIFSESIAPPSREPSALLEPTVVNLCLPRSEKSFKLRLKPEDPQQRQMLAAFRQGQYYQPQVSQLLMQVLQPGDSLVDLNASVGYVAALAAMLVGDRGSVMALEPQAESYMQILETIRLNAWHHVQARHGSIETAQSLDRLLAAEPLPKLLKLEADVLMRQGIGEVLKSRIPYLLCAIERSAVQQVWIKMAVNGYDAYALQGQTLNQVQALAEFELLDDRYLLLMRQPSQSVK